MFQILQHQTSPLTLRVSLIAEFVPKILEKNAGKMLFDTEEVFMIMNEIEDICLQFEIHEKKNGKNENEIRDNENRVQFVFLSFLFVFLFH